jgi:cell envelope opacity-associated protein A
MEADLLAGETKIRARRFRETAAALAAAAKAYQQAAEHLDRDEEQAANQSYKSAQIALEEIIDELPKPMPKHVHARPVEKSHHEWGWAKYMIPVGVVLVILYFLVVGGFSGDLSQGWTVTGDIRNAVRYPK